MILFHFKCFRNLLESSAVDPNTLVDKHCPCSALVRVCEDGLLEFAKVLIENGAIVRISYMYYIR